MLVKTPNKRVKFVPFGHPTRKSKALLLAAYARRWTIREEDPCLTKRRLSM
jgi:hypothetical protein